MLATFGSLGGLLATARLMLFGPPREPLEPVELAPPSAAPAFAAPARQRPGTADFIDLPVLK